jgi:integrase
MKVTVELKRPGQVSAIILHVRCTNGKLKYYTGESSDKITVRTRQIIKFIEATAADFRLASKDLSKRTLRELLDAKFSRKKGSVLIDQITVVIEKMKAGEIKTPAQKLYSVKTIKSLELTRTKLSQFDPLLRIVTIDTYRSFIKWSHEKKYSTNYIGTLIKNWKTLGRLATGDAVYDDPAFKKISEETFDIYLTEAEITRLYRLSLPAKHTLARDWFVLDCYTGLRISDLQLLSQRNLQGKYIQIANNKTGEKVVLPIHPYVKAILKKWKGFPQRSVTRI